ncbi:UbiD family decarboxylase [Candidatus Micrarchaeota archaeon]|nr:UbiD family decarboxylase [Candidatus Micrarchaeota archaeon]
MSFRSFIEKLDSEGKLVRVKKKVSPHLEAAGVLKELDGKPVLFENVEGSEFQVAGNIFSTKELAADYFNCKQSDLIKKLLRALERPSKPETVERAPCQEVVEKNVDLSKLPILFHCVKDGGPYVSSGVVFARDRELGQNASFHRGMIIGRNKFALRILPRHLQEFLNRNGGEVDVAMCVGLGVNALLAGATSVDLGVDEMTLANSLEPLKMVKAKTVDILVPADAEFILEGRIIKETHSEGPFVDLTETYDVVREQQVFEVRAITHRKNAVWHALLPGAFEHKLLMGMPREPTIFKEVNKVCKCLDVSITPGGCSWLHAVIQIEKRSEEDGCKAIEAAFIGHKSLKQAIVVDKDIDILNPMDVEWAVATRFQADADLVVKSKQNGSSLDPSSEPKTSLTCKWGLDATKPLVVKEGKDFSKVQFPKADLKKLGLAGGV